MIESGINIFLDLPVPKLAKIVQEAERLGYGRCWVYDEGLITRDPYVSLAAIAVKTSKIRLGTGITNPYTRHPGITASSIATLDELSGGRAFLGIGAGGTLTLDPLGLAAKRPLAAVREMIVACRALFKGERVNAGGKVFRFSSAYLDYGRSDLEIWLAGRGPKMLTMGGELADGVVLDFVLKDDLQYWVDRIRIGAGMTGNVPRICYSTAIIISEETLKAIRPHMTYRLVDSSLEVKERLGIGSEEVEAIRKAMASGGLLEAGKLVKDAWIEPFVIMGSVDECAIELKELMADYGMDEFLVPILETSKASRLMAEATYVLAKI